MTDNEKSLALVSAPNWNAITVLSEGIYRGRLFPNAATPERTATLILAGAELGFGPIASLTGIHIVQGRVTLSANLIAAAIKRSGRYDYRVRGLSSGGAIIEFFQGSESLGISTFTMDDARTAGLANKEVWKTYARNMLFSRAMSNGARWYCPDVFSGAVYTPEEMDVPVDAEGNVVPKGNVVEATFTATPEPAVTLEELHRRYGASAIMDAAVLCGVIGGIPATEDDLGKVAERLSNG